MRTGGPLFPPGMLACFSADSARTKNPAATRTATQKINLTAFDIFMLLLLFCAPAFPDFLLKTENATDAMRFSAGILRRRFQRTQAECLTESHNSRENR